MRNLSTMDIEMCSQLISVANGVSHVMSVSISTLGALLLTAKRQHFPSVLDTERSSSKTITMSTATIGCLHEMAEGGVRHRDDSWLYVNYNRSKLTIR